MSNVIDLPELKNKFRIRLESNMNIRNPQVSKKILLH